MDYSSDHGSRASPATQRRELRPLDSGDGRKLRLWRNFPFHITDPN
jgi:hypothetical protein